MNKRDMDVLDFARAISMRRNSTPIADVFDAKYGQNQKCWWTCQREHLTVWCLHQPTNGVKGFRHQPNSSARWMYYHFRRPETLLWLAESLGEDPALLAEQMAQSDYPRNLTILRERIPFDRILELLDTADK